MTRHLLEQHSGFSYKCLNCKKFVPRLKKHPGCNAGTASMQLFHRNTGKTGTEAQAMLDGYKNTMEQFFEETSRFARVPAQISPIKDPLPGRVNRLEGLYKNKPTTSFDSVPPQEETSVGDGDQSYPINAGPNRRTKLEPRPRGDHLVGALPEGTTCNN